ncbi:MAG: hypothetical protein NVSMB12_07590 [Acidimicrobiales bacterium]
MCQPGAGYAPCHPLGTGSRDDHRVPSTASRPGTHASGFRRKRPARWIARTRRRLVRRLPRWARGAVLTALVSMAIVVLALAGGLLSGKLEHSASTHLAAPPSTLAPTTTTEPGPEVQAVRLALIDDMTVDMRSQRLDPDPATRLAHAETPSAVARRHADIALAWAPDRVSEITARYDAAVRANAANPRFQSVTDAAFVVTRWNDVTAAGTVAHAGCRGHYRLIEPAGAVEQPDRDWQMTLTRSAGRWRLEDRTPPA